MTVSTAKATMNHLNLLQKEWVTTSPNIQILFEKKALTLSNTGDTTERINLKNGFTPELHFAKINFSGTVISGNAPSFSQEEKGGFDIYASIGSASLNSSAVFQYGDIKDTITSITLAPHSEVSITELTLSPFSEEEERDIFLLDGLENDILVLTPDYPAPENKYLCGFVHSRLRAYQKNNFSVDVICCKGIQGVCKYSYENIDVLRTSYVNLRIILRRKRYAKILVHFFDPKFALILDSCDLQGAELYFWCHNPETRYWESPKYAAPYFKKLPELTQEQISEYRLKDLIIKRYNKNPLVHWIFISEAQKQHSEEDIGITFNRVSIIPNIIDESIFKYEKKNPELRKKIFMLRKFDNLSSHSIDTCVRTIIELSRRECFADMEFNLYGSGNFYQELTEPLHIFPNVHLYPYFLGHEEIAEVHKNNGIALFATRYDSQGVSAGEAAMSGLAVVSSKIDAAEHFLPNDKGLLATPDNYIEYADIIERLYQNPTLFSEACDACHNKALETCSHDKTISCELKLIQQVATPQEPTSIPAVSQNTQALLSIVIPSYNVADYLSHGISTLMNQRNAHLLEIIIVNDGSKDDTINIARKLMSTYNQSASPIIKLIDKQNGGHGSTINSGLACATGTYFRVMDADDWLDSEQLEKLLEILKHETSDIIMTDYSEDRAIPSELKPQSLYEFMVPGLQYCFDDVCSGEYGFSAFGPIIATSCFKTKMLQDTHFELSEHCFYVDVEFDMYTIKNAHTVTFYPLNVYRYFIGRDSQSISRKSFIKNQKDHQKVISNVLTFVDQHTEISPAKREYIINNLAIPIIKTHYMIVSEWLTDSNDFTEFDDIVAQWPQIYHHPEIETRFISVHRKTKGKFLHLNPILLRFNEWQKQLRKS